ncbi:MAG: T9SS type A sorting domain-containing protein [Flavobacteriales bacterium]
MNRTWTLTLLGAALTGALFLHQHQASQPRYQPRKQAAAQPYGGALEWLKLMRANEATGQVEPQDRIRMARAVAAYARQQRKAANYTWIETGPDNIGGRVRGICVDPVNTQKLWAGGVSGGLFKSLDGANTWTHVTSFAESLIISSIAVLGNGHIYVATGNTWENPGGGGGSGFVGGGLFRSDDDGATWNVVVGPSTDWSPGTDWAIINRIKAHPTQSSKLLIASLNPGPRIYDEATGTADEITALPTTARNAPSYDVEVSDDGQVILWSLGSGDAFLSRDGGNSYAKMDNSNDGIGFPQTQVGRLELAISEESPDYMYAFAATSSGRMSGAWSSTNRGSTWFRIWPSNVSDSDPNAVPTLDIFRDNQQGLYDCAVAVRPGHPDEVWLGGVELWKTTLSGQPNQLAITDGSPGCFFCVHADVHEIVFADDQTAYIGCDGGVYKSPNGGVNFYACNRNLSITQFYSVAANATGDVIGGTQDNGSIRVTGYGNTVTEGSSLTGGDGFDVECSQMDTNIMFTSIYGGEIFRSNDHGSNFGGFYDNTVPVDPNAFLGAGLGDFYTNYRLYENPNDANSPYTVKRVFSIGEGDTIFPGESRPVGFRGVVNSVTQYGTYTNTSGQPIIGPWTSDTLEFQDRLTSVFAAGFTGSQGVWVTREALNFTTTPSWSKAVSNAGGNVNCLEWSSDGDHLFYGTSEGEIFRVSGFANAYTLAELKPVDQGGLLTTTQIFTGGNPVTGLASDFSDPDRLVATFGNYGGNSKVRRTENATGAATWTNIWNVPTELQGMPCYDAIIHRENINIIVVGSEFGVWATDDGGSTWTLQTDGIEGVPVFALRQQQWNHQNNPVGLDWIQNPGVIYAGTHGRGFFRTESLFSVPEDGGGATALVEGLQLVPNPAHDRSVINFSLAQRGDVQVNVYDLNGRLVRNISRRNLAATKQSIPVDTQELRSGTYLVELVSGGQRRSARLVVTH